MDSKSIFSFLHDHYLFKYLTDDELGQILPLFKPIELEKGEVLYRAGFPGRNFFIIINGQINLIDDQENETIINANGHFGEKALDREGPRKETAQALENSLILAINKRGFQAILAAYPSIKSRIKAIKTSNNIVKTTDFPWIGKDETIRYVDRKHINVLYSQLVLPIIFLLFTSIGAILLKLTLGVFLPISILIFGLWSIWLWLDWRNDYYIVTTERAAWVEKVIWLHDQRREVPLQSILSANISTTQMQRLFGYGDVIIRTYTGNIPMRNAANPELLLDLITETQEEAKLKAHKTESANISETIRTRLGLGESSTQESALEIADIAIEGGPLITESITPLQEFLNLFRSRYEINGVINYRKHVFILIKNSWWLLLLLTGFTVAFFARLVDLLSYPPLPWLTLTLILNLTALGYVFADWANDRFQITDKQIIDLDRKPFGRETKRSALLENILSLDYKRENIIQRLFDFGTVAINVGDIQLDFEYVANPVSVQNELFERYNAAVKLKEREDAQRRRDDMVEFLAAYHKESSDEEPDLDPEQS